MGEACPIRKLACGHRFHHACIQRWLQQNATCPLCKADAPAPDARAPFKVDLGHQEMAQIMTELEDIFLAVHACAGADRPVALRGLAYNLCVSLGYEDEDELEEAIGGSLADFLTALPHFSVVWPEEDAETQEPRATMLPEPAAAAEEEAAGQGRRLVFTVGAREDLWRLVLQGPRCLIEIPELEFAIRPMAKRRVDTIYNMIASAVFHLGDHVRKNTRVGGISDDEAKRICDTIDSLNMLLDVEEPFTWVLADPQGVSELKPMEGVHATELVEPEPG
mmetsp:Transcript_84932/g.230115  ORF Transcript_84932/g.230115 Transcript_84932/m.230115 type:complete len:278 (-) Transcript_84932:121-954(-)